MKKTSNKKTTSIGVAAAAQKPKPKAHVFGNAHDHDYETWRSAIQARLVSLMESGTPLFQTTAEGTLFDIYIREFPVKHRQYHNCSACRKFLNTYGSLAIIDHVSGQLRSVFWDPFTMSEVNGYDRVAKRLDNVVRRSMVTGVFVSSEEEWGTGVTGVWTHFSATPPKAFVYRNALKTPGQHMAEKREDFKNVMRAMGEYSLATIDLAMSVLESDTLYRDEKIQGPLTWFRELKIGAAGLWGSTSVNFVWLAVAKAPAGFCHPRSSMTGALLDDLMNNPRDIEGVKRRFAEKMNPLRYQRPQAAPTAGNIKRGEEIIAKLGLESSLRRRFANMSDVEANLIWRPQAASAAPSDQTGVFSHLLNQERQTNVGVIRGGNMTFHKFSRDIMPNAHSMELFINVQSADYCALMTASDPASLPILRWDRPEARNPVSWYVWHGGSSAYQWGLTPGGWTPISGITHIPSGWNGGDKKGVILLLKGMEETRKDMGLCLFPEILRPELHEIRATIEAFSRTGTPDSIPGPKACGLILSGGPREWSGVCVRVRTESGCVRYVLDRWE